MPCHPLLTRVLWLCVSGRDRQAETSERKVVELEEQVRDLMFFLEAQKTIAAEGSGAGASEMAGGDVGVMAKPTRGKKKKK